MDNTSFSDRLRKLTHPILLPMARSLGRFGFTPNMLSLIGMAAYVVAALVLASGHPYACAFLLVVFGPLDVLDGTLARDTGQESDYGAFLDATLDRYEEFFIYAGLLYYMLSSLKEGPFSALLVISALSGSFFVSYARAKAEALGFECSVGILTRFERIVLFILAIVTGWLDTFLAVIAVLSFVTTFQRMAVVARQARKDGGE